jgi:hypothetical protein
LGVNMQKPPERFPGGSIALFSCENKTPLREIPRGVYSHYCLY